MPPHFDYAPSRNRIGTPDQNVDLAIPLLANRSRNVDALSAKEWNELPFVMMQITAAKRQWDQNRMYWRDHQVQLGDVYLDFMAGSDGQHPASYLARYSRNGERREFPIDTFVSHDQVRYLAPGISANEELSTRQLGELLLGKLVTFYTCGLA